MMLGYVDTNDRLYDASFGTLKMKMRVESEAGAEKVFFSKASGEGEISFRVLASADVAASLAMDHNGQELPLLRPVEGKVYRHDGGLLFIAAPPKRDPVEPGFFLVQVRAAPSAVKFFFEDRGGTEFVSVPTNEILRVVDRGDSKAVYVTAESVALPNEKIAYALDFRPASRAAGVVSGLPLSP